MSQRQIRPIGSNDSVGGTHAHPRPGSAVFSNVLLGVRCRVTDVTQYPIPEILLYRRSLTLLTVRSTGDCPGRHRVRRETSACPIPILKQAVDIGDVRAAVLGELLEPVFRRTTHFNTKPGVRVG